MSFSAADLQRIPEEVSREGVPVGGLSAIPPEVPCPRRGSAPARRRAMSNAPGELLPGRTAQFVAR